MDRSDATLRNALRLGGYALFGATGTVVGSLALLATTGSLRPMAYHALYRSLGPWGATTAGTVLQFTVAIGVAIAVSTLCGTYLSGESDRLRQMSVVGAGLVALLPCAVAVAALTGGSAFLALLVSLCVLGIGVPVGLWYAEFSAASIAAFVGTLPVLAFLVIALAFGLGWGGGYDVVAEEISGADADAVTDFEDAPELRDDLFAPDACTTDGETVCRLPLRGYEHEARAARTLDSYGVRCPPGSSESESIVVEHDGANYRLRCVGYGD